MPSVPVSDINPDWAKVARRLESAAKKCPSNGYSVLSIAVLVDKHGTPMFWASPTVTNIEPAQSDAILHYLANGLRNSNSKPVLRFTPMAKPDGDVDLGS